MGGVVAPGGPSGIVIGPVCAWAVRSAVNPIVTTPKETPNARRAIGLLRVREVARQDLQHRVLCLQLLDLVERRRVLVLLFPDAP